MFDPQNVNGDDVPSWRSTFEYFKKYKLPKYSKAEKIAFVKTMTDRLQLSLDDIRGVEKPDKFQALSCVPEDLLPIEINLVGGEKCRLGGIDPVMTIYDDELDNLQGDVIRLYFRRSGEEQPEDFVNPSQAFLFKCEPTLHPFFVQEQPTSSTDKQNKATKKEYHDPQPSCSKEQSNLIKTKILDESSSTSKLNNNTPVVYEEIDLTLDYEPDWVGNKKHQTVPPPITCKADSKKHKENPTPSASKADCKQHQVEPTPSPSKVDEKHKEKPTPSPSKVDKKHKEKPAPNPSKADCKQHQVEPTPSPSKVDDEKLKDNPTPSTSQQAAPSPQTKFHGKKEKIKRTEVSCSPPSDFLSSVFLSKLQVVGLIETEHVNEPAPDVQLPIKEHKHSKQKHMPLIQNEPEITSLLIPIPKKSERIRPKKNLKKDESIENSSARQNAKKQNQVQTPVEPQVAQTSNSNKARVSKSQSGGTKVKSGRSTTKKKSKTASSSLPKRKRRNLAPASKSKFKMYDNH